jgi:hypothetical protein
VCLLLSLASGRRGTGAWVRAHGCLTSTDARCVACTRQLQSHQFETRVAVQGPSSWQMVTSWNLEDSSSGGAYFKGTSDSMGCLKRNGANEVCVGLTVQSTNANFKPMRVLVDDEEAVCDDGDEDESLYDALQAQVDELTEEVGEFKEQVEELKEEVVELKRLMHARRTARRTANSSTAGGREATAATAAAAAAAAGAAGQAAGEFQ